MERYVNLIPILMTVQTIKELIVGTLGLIMKPCTFVYSTTDKTMATKLTIMTANR